jgi:BolA protein
MTETAVDTDMGARMRRKLEAAFAPAELDVIDESHQHEGHAGARPGGQTHYRVVMRSASLKGLSRIERARAVHAVLAEELAGGVHALALDLAEPAA